MKKSLFVILLMILSFSLFADGRFVLVIDAGHGGKDSGAVGLKKQEKNIALNVAKLLGKKIKDACPDVDVYYTRDGDSFLELWQRTALANNKKANLFISIHCNSSDYNPRLAQQKYQKPSGFETFVMGVQKSERSLQIAMKENSVILQEDNYVEMYEGFNPNDPEAYIMMANMQDGLYGSLNQSIKFADLVQANMGKNVPYNDRKVQQAPFRVLYGLRCPSVLTEIGFINNQEEEAFMSSEAGSDRIANALYLAFAEYKKSLDVVTAADNKVEIVTVAAKTESQITNKPDNSVKITTSVLRYDTIVRIASDADNVTVVDDVTVADRGKNIYKVQFYTGTDPIAAIKLLNNPAAVDNYFNRKANQFSYTVGSFENLDDAIDLLLDVRAKGLDDAFIVARSAVSTQSYTPVSIDNAKIENAKAKLKAEEDRIKAEAEAAKAKAKADAEAKVKQAEEAKANEVKPEAKPETPKVEAKAPADNDALIYKVQFYTGNNAPDIAKLKDLGEIDCYLNKKLNLTSCTVGKFEVLGNALTLLRKVKALGFNDAFVAKFKDGERVY